MCLLRESEEGKGPQEHLVDPPLTADVSLAAGERPRAFCAGDCVRVHNDLGQHQPAWWELLEEASTQDR